MSAGDVTVLEFTIPGPPCGKGRPRFYGGHAVTPKATRTYESLVRELANTAMAQMVETPDFDAPCRVLVRAYWAVPASYSKRQRAAIAERGAMARRPGKPDIDNVMKAVLDGMNGIVFADDVQVVRLTGEKLWADDGERPRVEVRVEWEAL